MALVPTFSPSGWVSNPLEQIDFMLAYFFATQKSQTHFHKQNVTSYQSILADNPSTGEIKTQLSSYLNTYLSTIFQNVSLDVKIVGANGDPDNYELSVVIGCNFDANGVRYSISRGIDMLGTQVKRIFQYDETGELS